MDFGPHKKVRSKPFTHFLHFFVSHKSYGWYLVLLKHDESLNCSSPTQHKPSYEILHARTMSSSFRRGAKSRIPQSVEGEAFPKPGVSFRSPALGLGLGLTGSSPAASGAVFERIGTKPWIGGLTLTSSGLRELDAIFGGGQPLGTWILMEEDRWTQDLTLALVRYWAAEVSQPCLRLTIFQRP